MANPREQSSESSSRVANCQAPRAWIRGKVENLAEMGCTCAILGSLVRDFLETRSLTYLPFLFFVLYLFFFL